MIKKIFSKSTFQTFEKKLTNGLRNDIKNFKKKFSTNKKKLHGHKEKPTEDDIKFGVQIPQTPKIDILFAKIIGAFGIFWLWFFFRDNGAQLFVILNL
jgi:hypothetical protein